MPNKDARATPEVKPPAIQNAQTAKIVTIVKPGVSKVVTKEAAMSPAAPVEDDRPELLGSLTTQQQQRTSARVIKKLMLEPQTDKRDVCEKIECETPTKIEDPLKFPTVKQRMPKALWSADEKSYFFEALNEYGKDFDAITTYIYAKMKKKGMLDGNLKTKTQVSHFYYRTWHKLSKHVRFDENVKKVAQELYALINYGELRRKLASVNEKTCARLGEMVRCGSMAVRARGRTVRVRTPMCRALRRLNQIAERECGTRVCSRAQVLLHARDAGAWARVQAAAHNPRAATAVPLRTHLTTLLRALQRRWKTFSHKPVVNENGIEPKPVDDQKESEYFQLNLTPADKGDDLQDHLSLVTDCVITREHALPKKLALHVGPRPGAEVHLPVLSLSEQLSSQKICFSSYLERMGSLRRDKDSSDVKLRNAKRQRKDSLTDKDKDESKKFKLDDVESTKLMHIDETAIDGIELMAHFKNNQDDEEKPSTEDEKDLKSEETAEEEEKERDVPEREKDMSEKDKDSFSEMEDDEKFPKSDTDNESDSKGDKSAKNRKFKNLKVKFRLRPLKTGRSTYTMIVDKDLEIKGEESKTDKSKMEETKVEEETKPDIDVEMAERQIRKGWSVHDAGDLTIGDLYLMFGSRSKIELDYWWAEPTPPLPQPVRSQKQSETEKPVAERDKILDKREATNNKGNKTPEKGDNFVEDEREKRESDTDIIFSPKNTFSQDSNDGMSGDERKMEQLASPDHKSSGTVKLVHKLVNRPGPSTTPDGFSLLSDRLKRLLALAGNVHVGTPQGACVCGHVCPRRQPQKQPLPTIQTPNRVKTRPTDNNSTIFRHPTPIAPKLQSESDEAGRTLSLADLPPRRRRGGHSGRRNRRVVVQRLLPLLPKLPPPSNLIPVKIVPNSPPAMPRLAPKPPPTPTSDMSFYYVLSESNGQFYFHDGDRRIPITPLSDTGDTGDNSDLDKEDVKTEDDDERDIIEMKIEVTDATEPADPSPDPLADPLADQLTDPLAAPARHAPLPPSDIASFLPAESMSLSPSRLLRDAESWLEGSVQDFSLSSFLGHLEGRPQPEMAVDSQLQSLMAETSMDYVSKFADLAAEVTDQSSLADDLQ